MAIVILNPERDKTLRNTSQELNSINKDLISMNLLYKGLFLVCLALNIIFICTLIFKR